MFPTKLGMSKLVIKCSWTIAGDFPSMGRFFQYYYFVDLLIIQVQVTICTDHVLL